MSKNLRVPFAGFDGEIEQTDDSDKENKGFQAMTSRSYLNC